MCVKSKFRIAFAAAAAAAVPALAGADGYKFIISGDPVAAAVERSCSAPSSATALVTGTLSTPAEASSLEARYRTWDGSDGIALRSDKHHGFMLIVK